MRKIVLLSMLLISFTASGVSITEGERRSDRVVYSAETYVEIVCDNDACEVSGLVDGAHFKVANADLGPDIRAVPAQVALLYQGGGARTFSVQFEVECAEYAEKPPAYICMAVANFSGGALSSVRMFRRTFTDDSLGTKRISSEN